MFLNDECFFSIDFVNLHFFCSVHESVFTVFEYKMLINFFSLMVRSTYDKRRTNDVEHIMISKVMNFACMWRGRHIKKQVVGAFVFISGERAGGLIRAFQRRAAVDVSPPRMDCYDPSSICLSYPYIVFQFILI